MSGHLLTRRPAYGLVALLTGLTLVAWLMPASAQAKGKVKCGDSGPARIAKVDPILHHDEAPGAGQHEHQIFGNNAWVDLPNPNAANYDDLAGHGTDCRVSADTAGYWTPTLRYTSGPKAGQDVPAQQFTAYYLSWDHQPNGEGEAFPPDTRLVAMQADQGGWSCGQHSGGESALSRTIPDCSGSSGQPGDTLTAHVNFPSCWDGVLPNHRPGDVGDTSDSSHYAYRVGNSCPAGYPHKMVTLNETVQFAYTGNGKDVEASSDPMMGGADGSSFHADFWNAWDQAAFEQFVRGCVNGQAASRNPHCMP